MTQASPGPFTPPAGSEPASEAAQAGARLSHWLQLSQNLVHEGQAGQSDLFGGFRRDRWAAALGQLLNHGALPTFRAGPDGPPTSPWRVDWKIKLLAGHLTETLSQLLIDREGLARHYSDHAFLRQDCGVDILLAVCQCLDSLDGRQFEALKLKYEDLFPHTPGSTLKTRRSLSHQTLIRTHSRSASLHARSSPRPYAHTHSVPRDFEVPRPSLARPAFIPRPMESPDPALGAIPKSQTTTQAISPGQLPPPGQPSRWSRSQEFGLIGTREPKSSVQRSTSHLAVSRLSFQQHRRSASDSMAQTAQPTHHERNPSPAENGQLRSKKYSTHLLGDKVSIFNSDESVADFLRLAPIPPTEAWTAPKPASKNQSLVSYLQSGSFSRYQAELDRELAHIILAEAIIQGINISHYDYTTTSQEFLAHCDDNVSSNASTDDMDNMQQMLRIQRLRRNSGIPIRGQVALRTSVDSTTKPFMSSSMSSGLSSPVFSDDECSDDESSADRSALVSPNARQDEGSERHCNHRRESSAESLALTLLHMNNPVVQPKVCDLKWLVGDEDTPQKILPLPQSFQMLSDDGPVLRGTHTWAPPRPQLILQVHPKKKVFPSMQEQNFQCAGCSMTVQIRYIKTFRYCSYFGKYFCTSCHLGQSSVLPAKIVHQWKFKEEPVSTFARSVIKSLFHERLFFMEIISPELVKRVSRLEKALKWRRLAHVVFPYLMTCNRRHDSGDSEMMSLLKTIAKFDIEEPSVLTLNEICCIKLGSYLVELRPTVESAKLHILQCKYCHLQGHICEGCRSEDILFPFQLADVSQCDRCKACYHKPCLEKVLESSGTCTKCCRIQQRKMAKLLSSDATLLHDG